MHQQNVRETPVKGLNSLVATDRWRLINQQMLFDVQLDPAQNYNVASENPEIVADLVARYDSYWDELGMEHYPFPRPIIGSPFQQTTWLTTEDWFREDNVPSWQQYHILSGQPTKGYWPVEIAESGRYIFDVRRWPMELNHPMAAGLPERVNHGITTLGEPLRMAEGKAVPVRSVRLEIGEYTLEAPVTPSDVRAYFEVDLEAGETDIRAWMIDHEGHMQSAFYIYVTAQN